MMLYVKLAKLAGSVKDVDICIFPPHPFLVPVQQQIAGTTIQVSEISWHIFHNITSPKYLTFFVKQLGGQNCFFENEGAYTGAVRNVCVHAQIMTFDK